MKKLYFSLLIILFLLPGQVLAECVSAIAVDDSKSESWDSTCTSTNRPGSYAKYYTFTLTVRKEITINLTSSKDTYLFLLEGTGKIGSVLDENDDIDDANNQNSRIVSTLEPGDYTVEATTYSSATTGTFTVSVSAATPPAAVCNNLINTNTKVSGSWDPSCASTHRGGRYAKFYTFTLLSRQEVTVDLESTPDNYLFLLQGAGQNGTVLDADDDGGTGENARIFIILDAGTYTVEATTYASATTGNFFVTVNASPPSCDDCPFQINAGLNDAWFNPATNGQGLNITVYPIREEIFVTWFTFDTERPPADVTAILGGPGQRWLTAQGPYDEDTAMLTIYLTEGGEFDSTTPAASIDQDGYGTMKLEFSGCNEGLVTYEITSLDISGEIPIERIVLDNVPLCEMLAEP